MSDETMDFLEQSSGESHPAIKFAKVRDLGKGTILTNPREVIRPSLKDGQPENQPLINRDTSEGPRTHWVRGGFLAGAIADAVREPGAAGHVIGGTLTVKMTEERDTGKPNKAKVFKSKYEPPAASGVDVDEIFE